MSRLTFWFEFASTYSYPAAMRIEALCAKNSIAMSWQPFLLGPVFASQGLTDSPFNLNPAKGRYMWQDLARVCAAQDIPLRKPSVFPRGSLLGARVVVAFPDMPWTGAFVRALYTENFARDADIAETSVVRRVLREVGADPESVTAVATAPATKAALRAATDRAQEIGLFGAPSFTVGPEIFWGNDRLEMAITAAAYRL